MIEGCSLLLFQNTGCCASPQAVAQRTRLWPDSVRNQQKPGKEIRIVQGPRRSTDAALRCAGEFEPVAHFAHCFRKFGITRKSLEQSLNCCFGAACYMSIS